MSRLIVSLPPQPAGPNPAASDYVWLSEAEGRTGTAAAGLLPAAAALVALVPAERLAWHRVDLPRGIGPGSPRLRAVLDGLLEERLLDDPQSVFFALAPDAKAGGTTWVAACERQWLRGHLATLEAVGRPAQRVAPEAAPADPPQAWLVDRGDHAELLLASDAGVVRWPLPVQATNPLDALPLAVREALQRATLSAEPGAAALAEKFQGAAPVVQARAARWVAAANGEWDLAQFEFARRGRDLWLKRARQAWDRFMGAPAWRPARWGLLALVLAQLGGLNAWAWAERAALAHKRAAVRDTLTQTFPQVRLVVDAPTQMAREVSVLRQSTGAASQSDLEPLLAAAGAALGAGQSPTRLSFGGGELRLAGLNPAPGDVQAWAEVARARGVALRMQADELVLHAGAAR